MDHMRDYKTNLQMLQVSLLALLYVDDVLC